MSVSAIGSSREKHLCGVRVGTGDWVGRDGETEGGSQENKEGMRCGETLPEVLPIYLPGLKGLQESKWL